MERQIQLFYPLGMSSKEFFSLSFFKSLKQQKKNNFAQSLPVCTDGFAPLFKSNLREWKFVKSAATPLYNRVKPNKS